MIGRKAAVGLCMLSALALSAFAAQGAAASKGTTGFTCKEVKGTPGTVGFKDAHCKEAAEGEVVKYEHFAIPQDTNTEIKISNETTNGERPPLRFKTTISGVAVELQASTIEGFAKAFENKLTGTEHYIQGVDMITVTGVTVTLPAGKGCKGFAVGTGGTGGGSEKGKESTVILHPLNATTKEQGDALKFSPASEETLATFLIEGCSISPLNGTYNVTGSVKCTPSGGTCNFSETETTTAGTLKTAGQKVGIEGTLTFSARANAEEPYKPVVPTTVET
jgi:hypothetical protein